MASLDTAVGMRENAWSMHFIYVVFAIDFV